MEKNKYFSVCDVMSSCCRSHDTLELLRVDSQPKQEMLRPNLVNSYIGGKTKTKNRFSEVEQEQIKIPFSGCINGS